MGSARYYGRYQRGEPPLNAFGPPGAYARDVADSIGVAAPPPPRRPPGPVRLDVRGISKRYRRRPVLTDVDLTVRGHRSRRLVLGRLMALWTVGLLLSAPYFLLILFDRHDVRYGAIALLMLLAVAVAAPFGLALSAVLPRELEGTLVLLMVVGLPMITDPAGTAARPPARHHAALRSGEASTGGGPVSGKGFAAPVVAVLT